MDPWNVKWADVAESRCVINQHFDDSSNTWHTEVTDKLTMSQRVIKVVSSWLSRFLLHDFTEIFCKDKCWVGLIKRDQLEVTCFIISLFNAQHVSNVSTYILRSLRLICWVISWVILLWFNVCWCYVVVWLGWCGIRMQAEALVLHPDTTPPQPNHNVTPTHIEPEQYNPWNNSTNKSQVPEDGCINIRNMLSIK